MKGREGRRGGQGERGARGEEGEVMCEGARGDGPRENCILSEMARCRASGEEVVGIGPRR